MKRILGIALILMVMASGFARAGDLSDRMLDAAGFIGGAAVAYGIHEGGHIVAARITGTRLTWETCTDNQLFEYIPPYDISKGDGIALYSAGIIAQEISSEVILRAHVRHTPLVRGIMAWNVANPIAYATSFWFLNGHGDLDGIRDCAGRKTANLVAAGMVAVAVWQGVRFFGEETWAPTWMTSGRVDMSAGPSIDGFRAAITVKF